MVIEEILLVRAPVEIVWQTFVDLTRWADWNSVLKDLRFASGCIEKGSTFSCCVSPYAFPIYFAPKIEEVVPLQKIVWSGEKFGIRSRHEFLFSRKDKSTEVKSRELFSGIPVSLAGPLFPLERLRKLNLDFLRDLKNASEQIGRKHRGSMQNKIRLGISSCLLGEKVRYDGGHKLDHYLTETLGKYVEWVPVCPEVGMGLPVPREAMRLVGDPLSPRLVAIKSGTDYTERMVRWTEVQIKELSRMDLQGFIFKSRSPSSGLTGVKVYGGSGVPSRIGTGIFAREFTKRFPLLPVEDEGRLHDPSIRENFIGRIFVFRRWNDSIHKGSSMKDLLSFHTDHKLIIMSHSPRHYALLGRLVATGKQVIFSRLSNEYISTLMEGLTLIATTRKNTNVLHHILGYFKKSLSADEKKEMLGLIEAYHEGLIPLIVPVTLLNHYVRKYDEPYLGRQYYLNPHPLELMLRNHV